MKKLMAANWKMYKTWDEARATAQELVDLAASKLPEDREVLIFLPSLRFELCRMHLPVLMVFLLEDKTIISRKRALSLVKSLPGCWLMQVPSLV